MTLCGPYEHAAKARAHWRAFNEHPTWHNIRMACYEKSSPQGPR